MKPKAIALGVAAVLLAACGHDDSGPGASATPPSTNVNATTSDILTTYAKQPSEIAAPVPVNDGAFTITDTSDTTAPIAIN